jgi:hypothetical protein
VNKGKKEGLRLLHPVPTTLIALLLLHQHTSAVPYKHFSCMFNLLYSILVPTRKRVPTKVAYIVVYGPKT